MKTAIEVIILDKNGIIINKKNVSINKLKENNYIYEYNGYGYAVDLTKEPTYKYISGLFFKTLKLVYVFRVDNSTPLQLNDIAKADPYLINKLMKGKLIEEITEDKKTFEIKKEHIILGAGALLVIYLVFSFMMPHNTNSVPIYNMTYSNISHTNHNIIPSEKPKIVNPKPQIINTSNNLTR